MKMFHKCAPFALGIILSGCGTSPSFLNPASSIAEHEAKLYNNILIMALVVFVFVEICLIWVVIRDRKLKGDDTLPKQTYGNTKLEITWTAIPVLVTVVLFAMTVQTMKSVAAPAAAASDINVHVIGGHVGCGEFELCAQAMPIIKSSRPERRIAECFAFIAASQSPCLSVVRELRRGLRGR